MPLSAVVRARCRAFLPEGDGLHYVFPATSLAQCRSDFIIAVTDTTVTLLSCRWFRRNRPSAVWATYPRHTKLGPVELYGSLSPTVTIGPLLLEIDDEYVSVVRAADAEITNLVPIDPFPHL
ncbi:hypothetical protein JOF56_001762 [Kibdelosporangium banguiense]|uniref:Uncharacterized protein n=1 Tax=Kibdelosporangium banguiense TaxID=1365924 RepID=A0ABS4TAD1_9PSEU|nr:hypothetical protein [Kibdelosporangium banguiense]MBP2321377.1 hypothetical protein [Kibdelosporangium banguiense]